MFIVIIILIATHEYNRLVFGNGSLQEKWEVMALAPFISLAAFMGDARLILASVALSILIVFILFLLRTTKSQSFEIDILSKVVLGYMYIPFMMSHFILLRCSENGIMWILFILVLAFSGDIAAFYVGKTIGKRKLIFLVSPGKTIEGTVGLFIGSITGCVLFKILLYPALPIIHVVILGFLGSIIGQLGDLCESAIKRASGVKDSGAILMGHGGMLDRLDCLIFIVPFVYYYQLLVMK